MITLHLRRLTVLFILLVAFIWVMTGESVSAATLVVDDDGVECPGAGYSTIRGAYDDAGNGDTIEVCAGTYTENSLYVYKSLTFLGPQAGVDPRAGRFGDEAVITTPTGSEDMIKPAANDITIDGFTFEAGKYAIDTRAVTDRLRIVNNIISDIEVGIFLNRNGDEIVIEQNVIDGNLSSNYKSLIHIDNQIINDLQLTHNYLMSAPAGYGIFVALGSDVNDAMISGNEITGNNTGAHFESLNYSMITGNCFDGNGYAGLMGAFHNVNIINNTFNDNDNDPYETPPGQFWSYGLILLDDFFGGVPTHDVLIDTNTFSGNFVGIRNLWNVDTPSITVQNSCLFGNYTYAVMNNDAGTYLDCCHPNWWGHSTGPYHPTLNPTGQGDEITDWVIFCWWMTEEPICPVCPPECPCPIMDGIIPATSVEGPELVDVTITGDNFNYCLGESSEVKIQNNGDSAILYDIVLVDEEMITGTFDITGLPPGLYDLIFTNDWCNIVLEDAFEILPCECPELTGIVPDHGPVDEVVNVTVTGNNFYACLGDIDIMIEDGPDFVYMTGLTIVDENNITGTFDLAGLPAGVYDLHIYTDECHDYLNDSFEIEALAGQLRVTVYLNGHWAGTQYRPSKIDIELWEDPVTMVESFFDVALDELGEATVDLGVAGVPEDWYYIVVRQYNHLDLATSDFVFLSSTAANLLDMSVPANVACGEDALKLESQNGGTWTMPGGDSASMAGNCITNTCVGDCDVNIFDYLCMGAQWDQSGVYLCSDFTGDGWINIFDYFVLGQNWDRNCCPDVT